MKLERYAMSGDVTSKFYRPVAFITGASSGIGAAAGRVFAAAGYDVVLAARRVEKLQSLAAELASLYPNGRFEPLACDVNFDASVQSAFEHVKTRFGRLDVLINNAGFGAYGSVERTSLETFRSVMETNYYGVIRCTQAALPLLRAATQDTVNARKKWGAAIVMVSSFVGRRAVPAMSAYCASKFALEGLSETLRVELHDERISVSVVNPGVTKTEFVGAAEGKRPEHFINQSGGMTSEAVAQVLLAAVRRPRRNRYLTTAGRAGLLTQWLFPTLVDRAMLDTWRKSRDGV
jgi:NAD(P)-dependent dehydrogenase (short-subunit alcohol dehydrogenase family)